jgi:hypothetical protein
VIGCKTAKRLTIVRGERITPIVTPRRRRWIRRLLFALVFAGAVYLARAPLLRGMAHFLVVEDPMQEVDALVLLNGDRLYEQTALLYRNDMAKHVLLIQGPPSRLERMKILPDPVALARRELAKHDVPEIVVEVLPMEKNGDSNRARRLRDWLNEHPEARVCILCDRFSNRRTRCLFERELGGLSARVHWRALPDRLYDETNWYRNKAGVLGIFDGYLNWAHVELYDDASGDWEEWDPEVYQNNLP